MSIAIPSGPPLNAALGFSTQPTKPPGPPAPFSVIEETKGKGAADKAAERAEASKLKVMTDREEIRKKSLYAWAQEEKLQILKGKMGAQVMAARGLDEAGLSKLDPAQRADAMSSIEDEIAQLQVKLDQLPEQITRIQTAYTRGEFDVKALQVQQARIQQERDELSAQIATLTAELEAPIDWFALELEDVSRVAAQQQAAHVLETKDLDYFTWDEFRRFVEEYDLGMELHETEYFLLSRIKGLLTPPGDARQAPKRLRIRRPLVR